MSDITLLPSAKVPLIYPDTNGMTTEWYRFFWNIYGFTGTGVVPVNKGGTGLDIIGNHQLIIGNANNVFEPALLSSASITITYPAGFVNLELGTSTVTPGTYGSASQVGVFTVNQYGVLTAASNTLIGIDASQIISGTIASARISGSYTGITGVGTLTVGTWNATAIGVAYGGTGQTTYTNGQLLIGNTTGNTLTKATLTAGSGVTITNGAGSITISATGSGGTVTSVTGTAPVVSSGGTTPAISMAAANTTTNGYLTSTDWNTFNGKQPALVSGTNIKTVNGTSLLGSGDVGTIDVSHGGTGLTTLTAGYIPYGNGTSAFSSTSNLFWDSANKRLGIGTASPSTWLNIETTSSYGVATIPAVQIGNTSSGGTVGNPTGLGAITWVTSGFNAANIEAIRVNPGSGNGSALVFRNNITGGSSSTLTEGMRLPETGGLQVINCVSVGNVTPSTSGAGITFPATQSASTDVNTLDDYEEGTWTPAFSSTGATFNYSTQSGTYVKIGKVVYASFLFVTGTGATGTVTNALNISGLPFTANEYGGFTNCWQTLSLVPTGLPLGTQIYLYAQGTATQLTPTTSGLINTGKYLEGTVIYTVA